MSQRTGLGLTHVNDMELLLLEIKHERLTSVAITLLALVPQKGERMSVYDQIWRRVKSSVEHTWGPAQTRENRTHSNFKHQLESEQYAGHSGHLNIFYRYLTGRDVIDEVLC